MRRREFLILPAGAGILTADLGRSPAVVRVRVGGEDPFGALDRAWVYGRPSRVMARAHGAWWPSAQDLPNSWQAWIETEWGERVLVTCAQRGLRAPERPGVGLAVWRELSATPAWGA
jgi:hypothetical protein